MALLGYILWIELNLLICSIINCNAADTYCYLVDLVIWHVYLDKNALSDPTMEMAIFPLVYWCI